MKFNHKGIVTWDIPFQKMKIVTHQGLEIPFKLGIPGEQIKLNLKKIKKKKYQIENFKIAYFSGDRVPVSCPHFNECSGCQWLHVNYETTIRWKQNYIDHLLKSNSIHWDHPLEVHSLSDPFRTRFKATYPVSLQAGEIRIGLYKENSHEIMPISDCLMVPEEFNTIRNGIREWIIKKKIPVYDEHLRTGWLRYVLLQKGFSSGKLLITLIVTQPDESRMNSFASFVNDLDGSHSIAGIHQMINDFPGNTILTNRVHPIVGTPYLEEKLQNLTFRIAPDTFFQANPILALQMFSNLDLSGTDGLIEFYSGMGIISMLHRDEFIRGMGFESNKAAVTQGNTILELNRINHFHLEQMDLYQFDQADLTRRLSDAGITQHRSTVIADPPRRGLGAGILKWLTDNPVPKFIYISCNPRKFAEETKILINSGYKLVKLEGFDLFPFTTHLEVVGTFEF